MWFLAGTFGGVVDRTCAIPPGKAIFAAVGGVLLSFSPEFPEPDNPCFGLGTEIEKVRCEVNLGAPLAPDIAIDVEIDGVRLEDPFAYRAQSQPGGFTLDVPHQPSFLTDVDFRRGDRTPAVADGYFVYLKPMPPGVHTLDFALTYPDQSVDGVNYTLIVSE